MSKGKSKNPPRPDALPGEEALARIYRAGTKSRPPAALDAKILAEAHGALAQKGATDFHPRRWVGPLSTAAVVVLAVAVVLLMTQQGALNHPNEIELTKNFSTTPALPSAERVPLQEKSMPAKLPQAPAESLKDNSMALSSREAKAKAAAPAAAAPVVGRLQANEPRGRALEKSADNSSTTLGAAAMHADTANVVKVQAQGQPGAYQFNVTVQSPDTGCKQFADWWEVVSEDGKLLYRRVLLHSHVDEQPFTRSGGPVPIQPDSVVWVRAHMNTSGYGGAVLKGSVKSGFKPAQTASGFAAALAKQAPLPEGCDF